MARPKVIPQPGWQYTKVQIPPIIWDVCTELAKRYRVKPDNVFTMMLDRIASLFEGGANVEGLLGAEYKQALLRLAAVDGLSYDGMPPIDVSKLHTSTKTKSGFVGVYANGQGYRAMVRMPGQGFGEAHKSIGTFPTAERAAWMRYLHYKKHNLTYGRMAEEMEYWRNQVTTPMSEEQMKHIIIFESAKRGEPIEDLTPEERALERVDPYGYEQAIERYRTETDKKTVPDPEKLKRQREEFRARQAAEAEATARAKALP